MAFGIVVNGMPKRLHTVQHVQIVVEIDDEPFIEIRAFVLLRFARLYQLK